MKKSPVAGISGSIRVACLSRANLAAAERHGKRLDKTSQARAISTDPPYTDTGLDLLAQYDEHVRDAFVPKRQYIAKHIIVQFPKDLVNGEDPQFMARHARKMVEGIFGDQSVFGIRVDRDEKGRHIVDVFVAPKYTKVTKHTSKPAVTLTLHEDALAKKHGRSASQYGRGQAMQDAIFEYFRDVMKLPGVQRGDAKTAPGPDWLSAEQLREAELKEGKAKMDLASQQQANYTKTAETLKNDAAADREASKADREAAMEAVRMSEAQAKAIASLEADARAAADAIRIAANLERDAGRRERRTAEIESQRMREEAQKTQQAAATDRALAAKELQRANDARVALEGAQETARRQRSTEDAQIALLSRAADDEAGLRLRLEGNGFRMDEEKMTTGERTAYHSRWSEALVTMARNLARFLERMRDQARRLLIREKEVEKRVETVEARERDLDIQSRALAGQRAVVDAEAKETRERRNSLENERKAYELSKAMDAKAKRLIELAQGGRLDMDDRATTLRESFSDGSHALHRIDELPVWSHEVLRGLGHFKHQLVRISVLEGDLQKRLDDAAVKYPERAPAVVAEQHEVATAVWRAFARTQLIDGQGI